MRLMSEQRRKKVESLREREQLREYRSRLQAMLTQKLLGKYGDRGRASAGQASAKNQTIKETVRNFMRNTPSFNENNLGELEARVQDAIQALRSGQPASSGATALHGDTHGSMRDANSASRGSGTFSNASGGGARSDAGPGPQISLSELTEGVNEWTLLNACAAVENEEKSKNNLLESRKRQMAFKSVLDEQVHIRRSALGSTDVEDKKYFDYQQESLKQWQLKEERTKKEIERKMTEEREARAVQIKEKNARIEREKRLRQEQEIADLARCKREIEEEQARLQQEKEDEAERMRKVKLENMKERERRALRKAEEAAEDQRLVEAYKAKLEREEIERANAFAKRMERLEKSGQKWAQEGAGKEQMDFERRLEDTILKEAQRKEQADLDRERRDKQAIKDKQKLIAAANKQLIDAKMQRFQQARSEDLSFARKFRSDGEQFRHEEAERKRRHVEMMRQHQAALKQQMEQRRSNPSDPAKLSMSQYERTLNKDVFLKLEQDPELLKKVTTRVLNASPSKSPTRKSNLLS